MYQKCKLDSYYQYICHWPLKILRCVFFFITVVVFFWYFSMRNIISCVCHIVVARKKAEDIECVLAVEKFNVNTEQHNLFVTCYFLRICVWLSIHVSNTSSKKKPKKTDTNTSSNNNNNHVKRPQTCFSTKSSSRKKHRLDGVDGAVSSYIMCVFARSLSHNLDFIFIFQLQIFIVVNGLWQQNKGTNWQNWRRWQKNTNTQQQKHQHSCYLPVR